MADQWELVKDAAGVVSAEVLPVHAALLPSGKVLYFSGSQHDQEPARPFDAARLFEPATNRVQRIPSPATDLFCCGHCLLPNGNVMVAGGTAAYEPDAPHVHRTEHHFMGDDSTHIFDWRTEKWSKVASMADGRWYPTCVTLPEGRVLALSGHTGGGFPHENTSLEFFDPSTNSWTPKKGDPPTLTSPPLEETGTYTMSVLGVIRKTFHPMVYYPRLHVLPGGRVFSSTALQVAGTRRTREIDPKTGTLFDLAGPPYTRFTTYVPPIGPVPDPQGVASMENVYARAHFPSVLLPLQPPEYTARILICGEKQPKLFDRSNPGLGWQNAGGERPYPLRAYANGILLPDASVLVVGGARTEKGPFGPMTIAGPLDVGGLDADMVSEAELFFPDTNGWLPLSKTPNAIARVYHSVALLLPDGRVWIAGSNHDGQRNKGGVRIDDPNKGDARELRMEIYSPPYLFTRDAAGRVVQAKRPSIAWSHQGAAYGQQFPIETPDTNDVATVCLIRCSSVTHAFNPDQRYVGLRIDPATRSSKAFTVTAPPTPQIAPPGYYMLFVTTIGGHPSVAHFLQLTGDYPDLEVYLGQSGAMGNAPALSAETWTPGTQPWPKVDFGTIERFTSRTLIVECRTSHGPLQVTGAGLDFRDFAEDEGTPAFPRIRNSKIEILSSAATSGRPAVVKLTYTPQTLGAHDGTLVIKTSHPDFPEFSVDLHAVVEGFAISVTSPIDFGSVPIGVSKSVPVEVSNQSSMPASLEDFTFSDDAGSQFFSPPAIPDRVIPVSQQRRFDLTYVPNAVGKAVGEVEVRCASLPAPSKYTQVAAVTLTGRGLGPSARLTPKRLRFNPQLVRTVSSPKNVTLRNAGSAPLMISRIETTIDFDQTNSAPASLGPGARTVIDISFRPAGPGTRNGALTVYSNAVGSPHSIALTGTGVAEPITGLAPASLAFADQPVGTTGAPRTLVVSNEGAADLHVASLALTGPDASAFIIASDGCTGRTLTPEETCTIDVAFKPTSVGSRTASVRISDNAAGTPHEAVLSGTAIAPPAVTFDPTAIVFGDQIVGTTGAALRVNVTNNGAAPIKIEGVKVDGPNAADFVVATQNCRRTTLGPGDSCAVDVRFAPSAPGARVAELTFFDDGGGSPHVVPLSGSAVGAALTLTPQTLEFGNQRVGTFSPPREVTLSNSGTTQLTITSISHSGDFQHDTWCGSVLPPSAFCGVRVVFAPGATGARTGELSVFDGSGAKHTVALGGTGVESVFSSTPGMLSFDPTPVGTPSPPARAIISNPGSAPLTVDGVSVEGANAADFAVSSNSCTGAVLREGEQCSIEVTFTPQASGSRRADLIFRDNAAGSPHKIELLGSGS
jgi:hypothetical protein